MTVTQLVDELMRCPNQHAPVFAYDPITASIALVVQVDDSFEAEDRVDLNTQRNHRPTAR